MSNDRTIIKDSEDLQVWIGSSCHSFELKKKKSKCCKKYEKGKKNKVCKKCPRLGFS